MEILKRAKDCRGVMEYDIDLVERAREVHTNYIEAEPEKPSERIQLCAAAFMTTVVPRRNSDCEHAGQKRRNKGKNNVLPSHLCTTSLVSGSTANVLAYQLRR